MSSARREEYDDLNDYADRLDAAGDDLDEARDDYRAALAALENAEAAALTVVEDVRSAATARGRTSVLGDLNEYVNFASGTAERPLNVAFCVIAEGPEPAKFRDLIAARLRAAAEDLPLLETSTVTPVGAYSVKLTGSIAPENATEYLVVSDTVRASLVDAAMQMDVPAQSKASVLPGDFAGQACAIS